MCHLLCYETLASCHFCILRTVLLQRVVNKGVRDQQWFTDVEGTYMRLDIPLIVPQLLKQLEDRKLGKQSDDKLQ